MCVCVRVGVCVCVFACVIVSVEWSSWSTQGGSGGKFFIASCLVAGEVSCCQFQNWALSLFPPFFPSLSRAAFHDLCRCMLFITADRCFNSHQAMEDSDPARSHRCMQRWGERVTWIMSKHQGSLVTCSHFFFFFKSINAHTLLCAAASSHWGIPGAHKPLTVVLQETRAAGVLAGHLPFCWKQSTDQI